MKVTLFIIFSALAITLTACNQKDEPAKKSAIESKEVVKKAKETTPPTTNESAQKVIEPVKPVENGAKKPPSAGNATTEQTLSDTIDHAQAVTKTQKSEARQRGHKAVDDMMSEVEKGK
jgi:hypothetical protein